MSVYRQPVAWAPVSTTSTLLGRHNRSNVSPSSNAFIIGMRGVTENKLLYELQDELLRIRYL